MTITELWNVGDVIENEWKVLKILGGPGESGFGIVYVLQSMITGSVEAAKTFQQLIEEDSSYLRQKFRKEAKLWNRLMGHPNIVEPRGISEFVGLPFMMSEYIEEGDLSAPIRAGVFKNALAKVCDLGMQACDALTFAMAHGMKAHLDIKPKNCLLKNGHLKLCDFGLSRTLDGLECAPHIITGSDSLALMLSSAGVIAGTPMYMAPEQLNTPKEADHRADIFALGLMLIEMTTAKSPRNGPKEIPSVNNIGNGKFRSVIKKCLNDNPDGRFQSFLELREALGEIYTSKTGKRSHIGVVELDGASLRKWPGPEYDFYIDPRSEHPKLLEQVMNLESTDDVEELQRIRPTIERHAQAFPTSYHIQIALAHIHEFLDDDRSAAIGNLSTAAHSDVSALEKAIALFCQGQQLFRLGRHDESAAVFREAIRLDPSYGESHFYMGMLHYHKLDFAAARICFDEAVRLNPDSEDAYVFLGRVQNSLDGVEETFRNGLTRIPRSVGLADQLALTLMQRSRVNDAVGILQTALLRNPEAPVLHDDLACAYLLKNELFNAKEAWMMARQLTPYVEASEFGMESAVYLERAKEGNWPLCHELIRSLVKVRLLIILDHYGLPHLFNRNPNTHE